MERIAAASVGLLLGGVVLVEPSRASACGGACLTEGGPTIGVLLGIAVGAWAVFRGAAWLRQRLAQRRLTQVEEEVVHGPNR